MYPHTQRRITVPVNNPSPLPSSPSREFIELGAERGKRRSSWKENDLFLFFFLFFFPSSFPLPSARERRSPCVSLFVARTTRQITDAKRASEFHRAIVITAQESWDWRVVREESFRKRGKEGRFSEGSFEGGRGQFWGKRIRPETANGRATVEARVRIRRQPLNSRNNGQRSGGRRGGGAVRRRIKGSSMRHAPLGRRVNAAFRVN